MSAQNGEDYAKEGAEGGVPDAVEGEELSQEAEGPEDGSASEPQAAEQHAGAGGETQPANKKAPPVMPVWRKKRPTLVGSRVRASMESNFDQATEAFETIDMNQDGKISMRELRAALALIDPSVEFSDEELTTAIKIADFDGSGYVDATEFLRAFGPHALVKEEVQDGLHNMGKTADGKKLAYLSLSLCNINVNDVVLLNTYEHLRHLDLSKNLLSDLSPLSCLPHILTLDASNNLLTMVLNFKPPLYLREANFSNNRITAINPLSQHRFLEVLNLSGNRIREISGVRDNVSLRRLTLDNNCIMQISNLGNLPLRHLSLANNRLSAVNGYLELDPDVLEVLTCLHCPYVRILAHVAAVSAGVL